MKYLRTFTNSFAESFGRETAISMVWIWRGGYFALGVWIGLKLLGVAR